MEIIDFVFADEQLLTTITLLLLIALLIGNIVADKLKKYTDVDTNAAIALMDDDNLILLDIREPKERKKGHLANDLHIPMAHVSKKLKTLDKNKKILVYCRSGARSAHISGLLCRNEFTQVYNLVGGMKAWQKSKLPIKI